MAYATSDQYGAAESAVALHGTVKGEAKHYV